jgi:DNA-binding GntR family transcriptional regulator
MARTEIDTGIRMPLFRQLAEIIRTQIGDGKILPGYAIPPKRVLAETYGVSFRTVDSAIGVLKNEGLLETEPGRGLFVTEPADRDEIARQRSGGW